MTIHLSPYLSISQPAAAQVE